MTARELWRRLPWRLRLLALWWFLCAAMPVAGTLRLVLMGLGGSSHPALIAFAGLVLAVTGLLLAVPPVGTSVAAYVQLLHRQVDLLRRPSTPLSLES